MSAEQSQQLSGPTSPQNINANINLINSGNFSSEPESNALDEDGGGGNEMAEYLQFQ